MLDIGLMTKLLSSYILKGLEAMEDDDCIPSSMDEFMRDDDRISSNTVEFMRRICQWM